MLIYFWCCDLWCVSDSKSDAARLLDANLKSILEKVRLIYLMERDDQGIDATLNWEDILSLGEQQRLGMVNKQFLFLFLPQGYK